MNCPKCGQNYQAEDVFCGNCGTKLQKDTAETTDVTSSETTKIETLNKQNKNATEQVQSTHTNVNEHQNINQSVVNQNDTYKHIEHSLESNPKKEEDSLIELKQFFLSAFTRSDQVIKNEQTFSFKILTALIVAGLILISLFTTALIPDQIGLFEMSKANIVFRLVVTLAIILAVHIGMTYAVVRLTFIPEIKFNKVFSDYVLINTFTVTLSFISAILFALSSYKFASLILIIMYLFSIISPAYLIAKYGSLYKTRISSVYGILILIFTLSIIALIFGESMIENVVMQNFSRFFGRVI